jgi:putative redox protein
MAEAIVKHVDDLVFLGKSSSNHWVPMDTNFAGLPPMAGSSPKEMLLVAIGGCTGMDVVSLLKKRRVAWRRFEIGLQADVAAEHPRVYTRVQITYRFEGDGVPVAELERAIRLSQDKYCSVSAMVRKAAPIFWTAELNGQKVLEGGGATG